MAAVANRGPVVFYFFVENNFFSYSGGVYPASACRSNTINHAMLIVGYDMAAQVGWARSVLVNLPSSRLHLLLQLLCSLRGVDTPVSASCLTAALLDYPQLLGQLVGRGRLCPY